MSKTNMRKREEFLTDDGRRVECWSKIGQIDQRQPDEDETLENNPVDKVFFGIMVLGTQYGPKEIKFNIPDVKDEAEAFAAYPEAAEKVVEEITKQMEQARREQMGETIVRAPASALDQLGKQPNLKIITEE